MRLCRHQRRGRAARPGGAAAQCVAGAGQRTGALSTKTPTRLLAANARANPDAQNLNTVSALLLIGGGVPLTVGKDVIGAIGVGGAGGAAQDEGCALKAIAQVLPAVAP